LSFYQNLLISTSLKKIVQALFFFTVYYCSYAQPDPTVLKNKTCEVTIDRWGGAFTSLRHTSSPVNPLSWALTVADMPPNNQNGAPFKGHFLCVGRWGSPSDGEIAAGVPHNGEPSNSYWQIVKRTDRSIHMENEAPLDDLKVKRIVALDEEAPTFLVTESFENVGAMGRISNVVQHITIGPPFLSEQTVVFTNAKQGFNQKFSYPDPSAYSYTWPMGLADTATQRTIDMRRADHGDSHVTTHIFDEADEYGYVVAFDPSAQLVVGYVWKLDEYPWINIWHQLIDGELWAKGLEFGTTGIGRSYKELLAIDTRFHGVNSFEFIDAKEIQTKQFQGFIHPMKQLLEEDISITETYIQIGDLKLKKLI